MPLTHTQQEFITQLIENYISIPESDPELEIKISQYNTLFENAFAHDPHNKFREKNLHETNDEYQLFKTTADPCLYLRFLESQYGNKTISINEVQQFIFTFTNNKFNQRLQPPKLINPNNLLGFKTKSLKDIPMIPHASSWELPQPDTQMYKTTINERHEFENGGVNVYLDLVCQIYFSGVTLNLRRKCFYPKKDSMRENIKRTAIHLGESFATKVISHYLLLTLNSPQYRYYNYPLLNQTKLTQGVINVDAPYEAPAGLPASTCGLRLLSLRYYFNLVLSKKIDFSIFENLCPEEIRALKSYAAIRLLEENLCDFNQVKSLKEHVIATLELPGYLEKIMNKEINFSFFSAISPQQSSILALSNIRNLLMIFKNIPFSLIINICQNTLKLISNEFYYNLLILKKIDFFTLHRINDNEADILLYPEVIQQIANLSYVSSSLFKIIIHPDFAIMIKQKALDLRTLESISEEDAQKLLMPFIPELIINDIMSIEVALNMSPEHLKKFSGSRISYLLYQSQISFEQIVLASPDVAAFIERDENVEYYLSSNFFYRNDISLLSFIAFSKSIFNRIEAIALGNPSRFIDGTIDNKDTIMIHLAWNIQHGITKEEILAGISKLYLIKIAGIIIADQYSPCVDIVNRVNLARAQECQCNSSEKKNVVWLQAFDAVNHLIQNIKFIPTGVPFIIGGPFYCRTAYPTSGYRGNQFFMPSRIPNLFAQIKTFAEILYSLSSPTAEADYSPRKSTSR